MKDDRGFGVLAVVLVVAVAAVIAGGVLYFKMQQPASTSQGNGVGGNTNAVNTGSSTAVTQASAPLLRILSPHAGDVWNTQDRPLTSDANTFVVKYDVEIPAFAGTYYLDAVLSRDGGDPCADAAGCNVGRQGGTVTANGPGQMSVTLPGDNPGNDYHLNLTLNGFGDRIIATASSDPFTITEQPSVPGSGSNVNNEVASEQSVFTTPTSGPAGTMMVLNGNFSACGNQVPVSQCTINRFNNPIFLQGGTSLSGNVAGYVGSDGNIAYQVPFSLAPGRYEFAIQNCFGKGCSNYHLGWFTVTANTAMIPTINSISPQTASSTTLAGTIITINGNNFSANDNYISFVGDGMRYGDGSPVDYSYISDASSSDGKTITLRLPTCSASSGPTCQWVPNGAYWTSDGGYQIAVSNVNGTSNSYSLKTH